MIVNYFAEDLKYKNFLSALHVIIPATFIKFTSTKTIVINAATNFQNIRGEVKSEDAIDVTFTREESDLIHWNNIYTKDIPNLAHFFWVNRGIELD